SGTSKHAGTPSLVETSYRHNIRRAEFTLAARQTRSVLVAPLRSKPADVRRRLTSRANRVKLSAPNRSGRGFGRPGFAPAGWLLDPPLQSRALFYLRSIIHDPRAVGPADLRADPEGNPAAGENAGADRQRKPRVGRRARGGGQRADQQVRRGLSKRPLLPRLRI